MSPETPTGTTAPPGRPGGSFCFRLRQERPGWNVLLPTPTKAIVDLATLVREAPEFIGMDSGGAPCRATVLLSEQGEARVLAALDEAGGICLVGHPLQLTREVLTVVVRDLLTYSGQLWRMPLEEFTAAVEKGLGRNLGELFAATATKGWTEATFRAGLRQSLERGRFPVAMLLSGTNKDVVEALVHLKFHGLIARPLGAESYESWGIEVVVPKVLAIPELGLPEGADQARAALRPSPPPRSQLRTGQVANFGVSESAQPSSSAPTTRMPWADRPPPDDAFAPAQPPAEPKPVRPQPTPKPQTARTVWDGSMPGVMAGKRPPPEPKDEPEPRRGQEPPRDRR